MADDHQGSRQSLGRLFNYANNPLTIAGAAMTTLSAVLILVFTATELAGGFRNPYVPMLAFVVMPAFFVLGLVLIPPGMWRRRRRLIAAGVTGDGLAAYPNLDFNRPQVRKVTTLVLGLTAANAVILGSSSFLAVGHMDSVGFCGTTCHTVMQPEYTAYQGSPHSRVACVECHIGPGASWFVRSKLDGLRQVWHTAMNTYHRPIETPVETLRPARETCERCHWPAKHHGDKLRVFARHATDEASTAAYTAMVLRTGGGSLDLGTHGGIHWWHIYSDNRIRYLATDERRQEIGWVELVGRDGERRVYTRPGEELPPEAELERRARVMDCIDCHNRPTHLFQVPAKAVDELLEARPELAALPHFKRQALAAVEAEHPTHAAGVAAAREAILAHYRGEQPGPEVPSPGLVTLAADAVAAIRGRVVFPEMKTDWATHANNVGHDDAPGCWRCHDDTLVTADGAHAIPQDCDTCHALLVEASPTRPDLAALVAGGA